MLFIVQVLGPEVLIEEVSGIVADAIYSIFPRSAVIVYPIVVNRRNTRGIININACLVSIRPTPSLSRPRDQIGEQITAKYPGSGVIVAFESKGPMYADGRRI